MVGLVLKRDATGATKAFTFHKGTKKWNQVVDLQKKLLLLPSIRGRGHHTPITLEIQGWIPSGFGTGVAIYTCNET